MKKKKIMILMAILITLLLMGGGFFMLFREGGVLNPEITSKLKNGETVSLLNGKIYEFAKDYTMEKRGTSTAYCTKEECFAPADVVLKWDSKEVASEYVVLVGKQKNLSDAEKFTAKECSIPLKNLEAGTTYYYQITAECEGKTLKSRVLHFRTAELPRTVVVDGVSNTRDIGGYVTEDGKHRIRQNIVWRGATLETITEEGKDTLLNRFGVKTVLAVNGDRTDYSILGAPQVKCIALEAPWYYCGGDGGNGVTSEKYKQALLQEIRVFADEKNYPIYFHCSLGRDRTGTLSTLLLALCGVSEKDLYLDYELSWFSSMGWFDANEGEDKASDLVKGTYTNLILYILCCTDGRAAIATNDFKYLQNELSGDTISRTSNQLPALVNEDGFFHCSVFLCLIPNIIKCHKHSYRK